MNRFRLLTIGFLFLFTSVGSAYARTPITGTVVGDKMGLIHMDYTTAIRPPGYAGPQTDFVLNPRDPAYTQPGLSDFTAQVYDLSDPGKCNESSCALAGFLWSDTIGWILMDGSQIKNALPDPSGFPDSAFARAHYNGALSGYLWSEHAGWIRLSSDDLGVTTPPASQTADTWGVYFDPSSEVVVDPGGEGTADDRTLGRPFHGYAWSEHLGWIKFGPESGDSAFGAYTTWIPDRTPPELLIVGDNKWFKNTSVERVITWPGVARDSDSGLREVTARFTVARDSSPDFIGCQVPLGVDAVVSDNTLSLTIPSIGDLSNATLGYCKYTLSGHVSNNAGLTTTLTAPITFYVRAGDVNVSKSGISLPISSTGVADGKNPVTFNLNLVDVASNPVVDIDCSGCPGRHVNVTGQVENHMWFDSIYHPPAEATPVRVNSAYLDRGTLSVPPTLGIATEAQKYPFKMTTYAPTTTTYSLRFLSFDVTFSEDALPAVSSTLAATASQSSVPFHFALPEGSQTLAFLPALVTTNAQVKTGEAVNQLLAGSPSQLSFQIKNNSTETLDSMDFDTHFAFGGKSPAVALAETRAIEEPPSSPGADGHLGWLDPNISHARMEFFSGTGLTTINSLFATDAPAPLSPEGTYPVDKSFSITGNEIDRSDTASLAALGSSASLPFALNFTPTFFIPTGSSDLSDIQLQIEQQIGYRFSGQPLFTVYAPDSLLLSGLGLGGSGAKFKGVGAGKTIFDGHLNVISSGVKGLKEQIRRNVATLTLNRKGGCPVVPSASFSSLPSSIDCVSSDSASHTMVAYYSGSPTDVLPLGDGASVITVPADTHYTLILKGGANLLIRSNIVYGNENSSLGIILLGDSKGQGANVYVDPGITNMVGSLFAEGSLLSSPNGSTLYYGSTGVNASALKNQLFWQGSIATLNTLGGANQNVLPAGVECLGPLTLLDCAQRYDLNFLRRFSVTSDGLSILNGGLFSGGGSCINGSCSIPPSPLSSFSTVSISAGKIDKNNSESLDAFYISPTSRPAPPGFSLTSELQSAPVIR